VAELTEPALNDTSRGRYGSAYTDERTCRRLLQQLFD